LIEEGVYRNRGKGSENEITLCSLRLRQVIADCQTIYPKAPYPMRTKRQLIDNKQGRW